MVYLLPDALYYINFHALFTSFECMHLFDTSARWFSRDIFKSSLGFRKIIKFESLPASKNQFFWNPKSFSKSRMKDPSDKPQICILHLADWKNKRFALSIKVGIQYWWFFRSIFFFDCLEFWQKLKNFAASKFSIEKTSNKPQIWIVIFGWLKKDISTNNTVCWLNTLQLIFSPNFLTCNGYFNWNIRREMVGACRSHRGCLWELRAR